METKTKLTVADVCTMSMCRALHDKLYTVLLEDSGHTFNINMHTYMCFALSEDEAVGKMVRERPEFRSRKIQSISHLD